MKYYKYLILAATISIVSSLSYGEIHFGDVSGAAASDGEQSLQSVRNVLSGVAREQKFIWVQPLGTKTETTKDGKIVTTILYKAATATPSKYTVEEQIKMQREFEKKHGITSRVSGGITPTSKEKNQILELLNK